MLTWPTQAKKHTHTKMFSPERKNSLYSPHKNQLFERKKTLLCLIERADFPHIEKISYIDPKKKFFTLQKKVCVTLPKTFLALFRINQASQTKKFLTIARKKNLIIISEKSNPLLNWSSLIFLLFDLIYGKLTLTKLQKSTKHSAAFLHFEWW